MIKRDKMKPFSPYSIYTKHCIILSIAQNLSHVNMYHTIPYFLILNGLLVVWMIAAGYALICIGFCFWAQKQIREGKHYQRCFAQCPTRPKKPELGPLEEDTLRGWTFGKQSLPLSRVFLLCDQHRYPPFSNPANIRSLSAGPWSHLVFPCHRVLNPRIYLHKGGMRYLWNPWPIFGYGETGQPETCAPGMRDHSKEVRLFQTQETRQPFQVSGFFRVWDDATEQSGIGYHYSKHLKIMYFISICCTHTHCIPQNTVYVKH